MSSRVAGRACRPRDPLGNLNRSGAIRQSDEAQPGNTDRGGAMHPPTRCHKCGRQDPPSGLTAGDPI